MTARSVLMSVMGMLACASPTSYESDDRGTSETDTDDADSDNDSADGLDRCEGPQDCPDSSAPFCDEASGQCVPCGELEDPDGGCAATDPERPVCVVDTCVACTPENDELCTDTKPICEAETNRCTRCERHEDCPQTGCNLVEGNCIDPESVFVVDGSSQSEGCLEADGSTESPYCSIGEALADAGSEVLLLVHGNADLGPYVESNTITGFAAILGHSDGAAPVLQGDEGPALTVASSGRLSLERVKIVAGDGGAPSLRVSGGQARIVRGQLVSETGTGLAADSGSLVGIENSFIVGGADAPATQVTDSLVVMNYTTVAAGVGTATALSCTDLAVVQIRNSLLVSLSDEDELQCVSSSVETSALEMDLEGNTVLSPMDTSWFVDYPSGDLSLADGEYPAEIEVAATWREGDPSTDINDDPRPTADGDVDFAGADRL